MVANTTSIDRDEFARKGNEIYERVVRPVLRPENQDQFVAIDIESSRFEIDRNDLAATERLLHDHPGAKIWIVRVGQPAAYRIGGHLVPREVQ